MTIEMTQGKTKKFRFTVTDKMTNVAVDITSWSKFWFMGKVNVTDADGAAVISKTVMAGITVISPTTGVVEVQINAADTSGLADTQLALFAEFQGLDAAGLVWDLWDGALLIHPHVIAASA